MFWNLTALSASSPVDSLLDKENFTLEELLDEEEIIQECKALNSRLINFLRDRPQVEQLLRYIIEEPLEDADNKRTFKFPFIACEIFTCEIDVILKTLVEEEELMDMLFSFLEPSRPHSALLAGYFSKVVTCLMLRKTVPLMNYVQSHQDVFRHMVDLIGITSITEVLVRLVGADYHLYPNSMDVMQWLADSDLLEMIVDKLNPSNPSEVHANAAETLCAITRNSPSLLATKLSSPSFVAKIFNHALEYSESKSALIHSLSVCISMLDPKRSISPPLMYTIRNQHIFESPVQVNPDTVGAMLPRLADLLVLLSLSNDDKVLPTTYGELKPPLGKHRLKIVEFIAVLLKSGNEVAEEELVSSGTIKRILDLFFEFPFNNALHHHVESIINSCLDSKKVTILEHLLRDCKLAEKILQADGVPTISGDYSLPTIPSSGRQPPRAGYIGHITRISNKIVQLSDTDSYIQAHFQENPEWNNWRSTVLQERNTLENVYRWACGRPTAFQDRTRDSDEEDAHDRDYDVAALANNLSQAFRYTIYDNDDNGEGNGALDRDDEDVYFDDESAEVVISSLRLGDDQGSNLFTNSNWFAFQDDTAGDGPVNNSDLRLMEDINLNGSNSSSSDDELAVSAGDGDGDGDGDDDKEEEPALTNTSCDNGTLDPNDSTPGGSNPVPSLFEEDVEFVGVEMEGTEKAMDQALKEGIVGEAGPLKKNLVPENETDDDDDDDGSSGGGGGGGGGGGVKEFNDANYWRVDQEVAVSE